MLIRSPYRVREFALRAQSAIPHCQQTAVSGRRYYSPSQGRFLGRDPKKEKGGLNLYGFVTNNPVNCWDLLGMTPSYTTDGKTITISATLVFTNGTDAQRGAVIGGIQAIWSGSIGDYKVVVNLTASTSMKDASNPIMVTFVDQPTMNRLARDPEGNTNGQADRNSMDLLITPATKLDQLRSTAGHEFGHTLGIPHDPNNRSIMFTPYRDRDPSARPTTRNLRDLVLRTGQNPYSAGGNNGSKESLSATGASSLGTGGVGNFGQTTYANANDDYGPAIVMPAFIVSASDTKNTVGTIGTSSTVTHGGPGTGSLSGATVLTDPQEIAEALGALGGGPGDTALDQKSKIELENAR